MNISDRWLLTLLLFPAIGAGHSVSTHKNIMDAAVRYLQQQDPRFASIPASQLISTLQIGAEHEDDFPRFVFHFSPRLDAGGFSATCSSTVWGFIPSACLATLNNQVLPITFLNAHTWDAAAAGARNPRNLDPGWDHLGYVLHLLQDLTSPAHVRNDPHPPGTWEADPLEAWDRYPLMAAPQFYPLLSVSTPQQLFTLLQNVVRANFFSKDTCFDPTLPGPVATYADAAYFWDAPPNAPGRRRLAYKGWRYLVSLGDRRASTIDDVIADEQFNTLGVSPGLELGPLAVQYTASLIRLYSLRRLTVSQTGTGSGVITSVPSGINCGVTCSVDFVTGDSVALTAAPSPGSTFAGWSGDCSGQSAAMVLMSQEKTCTARFDSISAFVFEDTFSPQKPGWSFASPSAGFLGELNNNVNVASVTLTVPVSAGIATAVLEFDLLGFRTLDGATCCRDTLTFRVNGSTAFSGSWSDNPANNGFLTNPSGAVFTRLSPGPFGTSSVHHFTVNVQLVPGANVFTWTYTPLQSLADEAWGLDNVTLR